MEAHNCGENDCIVHSDLQNENTESLECQQYHVLTIIPCFEQLFEENPELKCDPMQTESVSLQLETLNTLPNFRIIEGNVHSRTGYLESKTHEHAAKTTHVCTENTGSTCNCLFKTHTEAGSLVKDHDNTSHFYCKHTEINCLNDNHLNTDYMGNEYTIIETCESDCLSNENTETSVNCLAGGLVTETDFLGDEHTVSHFLVDEHTEADFLVDEHTESDFFGNEHTETNYFDNENNYIDFYGCAAANYFDDERGVDNALEINSLNHIHLESTSVSDQSAGNNCLDNKCLGTTHLNCNDCTETVSSDSEQTGCARLCHKHGNNTKTNADDFQDESPYDLNFGPAICSWEQTLISDFQSIRNDLAQFEQPAETEACQLQDNLTYITSTQEIKDCESGFEQNQTFKRTYASKCHPDVSTDQSTIISQLKEIRNELLHLGTVDVFVQDDLGLDALFQEQPANSEMKVNTRSKSSKRRKRQQLKLVNPPKNGESGRHKRFATSFEELQQSSFFFDVEVDPKFTCSVCLELYYIPTACSPCGHLFCDPCLRRLTAHGTENVPCPLCRTVIARCDVDTELETLLMSTHPELYAHRATQEQASKYRHFKLPLTIPVPLRRRIIRRMIASRNSQSDSSWMSHDWFKFLLGCTAGICLSLIIMVLNRVKTVNEVRDVNIIVLSIALGASLTAVVFKVFKI